MLIQNGAMLSVYFHVFSVIYKLHQHLIPITDCRDELDLFFLHTENIRMLQLFLATAKNEI